MINKRLMIVLDSTEMPREVKKALRTSREHWISNDSAVFIDVPKAEDITEYDYESDGDKIITEYLVSEGIEPGTQILIHYWW
jgi:hypothetical protein